MPLTDLNQHWKEILFLIRMMMWARDVEITHDVSGCLLRLGISAVHGKVRCELLERGALCGNAFVTRPEHLDRFVERGRRLDQ
ncbi:hypothetical protein WK23_25785 [Burkholderia vietnamiensis]|nr:hypothetical protein WK23_25785 [Burkholderia vietnamiensis]